MSSKKIGMLFTFLDSALLPQLLNGLYGEGGDGMSRLIDADKLKKVLEKNFGHTGGASVLAQLIDAQPTVTPEPHWIPVEQALPEKDGRYYVTLENKYVEILYYAVEQTIRHPKGFYYLSEDGRMTWRQTQNPVVAWMPLPEPFKGVTE